MKGIVDIGCFWGHWPFFRTKKQTVEEIEKLGSPNGIEKCLFSSIDAIFLRDPMQGDEELHEALIGTHHKQVLTSNPTMPAALDSLRKGVKIFNVGGVRIYPGYHDYKLTDSCVHDIANLAADENLPLIVNMRVEDERLHYVVKPRILDTAEVEDFLYKTKDQKVVLSNIYIDRLQELNKLKKVINELPNVYFDTCGLKDNSFIYDKVLKEFSADKIIYASQSPIYVRQSSLVAIQNEISEEAREKILWDNAHKVFSI